MPCDGVQRRPRLEGDGPCCVLVDPRDPGCGNDLSASRNPLVEVLFVPFLPVFESVSGAGPQPGDEGHHWGAVRRKLGERFQQAGGDGEPVNELRRGQGHDGQLQRSPRLAP
jgi:hypothetical protein